MIQTKNKTGFIPEKAHKQNLSPYQHKVKDFAHRIWCSPLWYSQKRLVQNT